MQIRELREKKEMSQSQLSAATGLTQAFICELENGKKKPSFDTLIKLTRALECSMDDLTADRPKAPETIAG